MYCPDIEEFLQDCFLYSIKKLSDPTKVELIRGFHRHVTKLHCGESLHFLLEVINYESNFYLVSKGEADQLHGRKSSSSSLMSFRSNENVNDAFASTIDDLNANAWDNFRLKNLDSDSDDDDDDSIISMSHINENDFLKLQHQWKYIINTFIVPDAEEQVNLSTTAYEVMIDENKTNRLHHPAVLLVAKDEIIRLLNENVYYPYLRKQRPHCKGNKSGPNCCAQSVSPTSSHIVNPSVSNSVPITPIQSADPHKKKRSPPASGSLSNFLHLKLNPHSSSTSPLQSNCNSPDNELSSSFSNKFKIWPKKK